MIKTSTKIFLAVSGILLIVLGIVCIANPAATLFSTAWMIGCLTLVSGIAELIFTPIQAGSIIGEYNFQYAIFGMMQGITETVLKDNRGQGAFPIIGSGPVPFFEYNGLKMTYKVENCS